MVFRFPKKIHCQTSVKRTKEVKQTKKKTKQKQSPVCQIIRKMKVSFISHFLIYVFLVCLKYVCLL